MAMQLRIVCPEDCAYDGPVAYIAVPAPDGEFGVLPRHASEVCVIEGGRIRVCEEKMGVVDRVFAVSEGYIQIANDEVIVLVDRAVDMAKVDTDDIARKLAEFEEQLGKMSADDVRRAYLYNEVAWCKLLLSQ